MRLAGCVLWMGRIPSVLGAQRDQKKKGERPESFPQHEQRSVEGLAEDVKHEPIL
jgi:hypothetical protein